MNKINITLAAALMSVISANAMVANGLTLIVTSGNQLCFAASVSAATQPPILFRKGRLSNIPEFHPAPAEKGLDAPPLCLEALPGLQSPCGCGLSAPEKRGSFLL